ncbi:hypothetical protein GCG54_00000566 [Colletotrichum gloeosporioides]|uniref:Rhodopsin domain-containing protein n=1 Tax=Colletotrichum gloeosporioides TaxID=474922 RepID=A0A8H4FJJ8_COLGL|nr:uncharacterized protein GCG54_00000566 [Colletotrichum gloeosporioides]KAF3804216.1 hypothetical protein GCG54_00000566 [Colletotrichum gloeosporioides]
MNATRSTIDGQESDDKSGVIIGVAAAVMTISTAVVGMRILSRSLIKQLGWDDCAAVASLAFFVSLSLYFAAIIFIKMTFLLQYYRLLEVSRLRYVLIGCMVVIFLWGLSQTFVAFLQCIPLDAVWDHTIESKCIKNIAIIWYFNGTFNIFTDFIIITLPIPKILQLQMPRTQKVVVVGVFMLGFFTIAISILRMQWLNLMPDRTWWNVKPAMWSLAEITCAILCACLPCERSLSSNHSGVVLLRMALHRLWLMSNKNVHMIIEY